MTSFASNLLLVAWAEDYIFILHAEYNKFARFSYTNNPALKAEIEPLLNQKLCELYHSWELEREEKEEDTYVEFFCAMIEIRYSFGVMIHPSRAIGYAT